MSSYNIVYSDTLKHHGVKGMKWGVRNDKVLTDKQFNRKYKKASRYSKQMNKLSKAESVYSRAAQNAQKDADDYRKKRQRSNTFVKIISSLDQYVKDTTVRSLKSDSKSIQKRMNKIIKKLGNDPYLSMDVYLKDVWGMPYDLYNVNVSKNARQ